MTGHRAAKIQIESHPALSAFYVETDTHTTLAARQLDGGPE